MHIVGPLFVVGYRQRLVHGSFVSVDAGRSVSVSLASLGGLGVSGPRIPQTSFRLTSEEWR